MKNATETVTVDLDGTIYRHTDRTLSDLLELEVFEFVHSDGVAEEPTYQLRIHDEPPLTRGQLVNVVQDLIDMLASTMADGGVHFRTT